MIGTCTTACFQSPETRPKLRCVSGTARALLSTSCSASASASVSLIYLLLARPRLFPQLRRRASLLRRCDLRPGPADSFRLELCEYPLGEARPLRVVFVLGCCLLQLGLRVSSDKRRLVQRCLRLGHHALRAVRLRDLVAQKSHHALQGRIPRVRHNSIEVSHHCEL